MSTSELPSYHVRNKLYVSHFLSTWNSRLFEFGAVLFISTIFPGTLFPASIYALTRSASVVVCSTFIGRLIDRSERMHLIRLSISKLSSLVNTHPSSSTYRLTFVVIFLAVNSFARFRCLLACSSQSLTTSSWPESSHCGIVLVTMALIVLRLHIS